jgi:hypothetical protein
MRTSANISVVCPHCGKAGNADLGRLQAESPTMLRCSGCDTEYSEAEAVRVALRNASRTERQGCEDPPAKI